MSIYGTFVDLFLILDFSSKCAKASSIFVLLALYKVFKESDSRMGIQKDLVLLHGALVSSLCVHSEYEIETFFRLESVLRILDIYPRSEFLHPRSRVKKKDTASGSSSKNLNIFNPVNCF
jgi:hypothetical protein